MLYCFLRQEQLYRAGGVAARVRAPDAALVWQRRRDATIQETRLFAEQLNTRLLAVLQRPDLRVVAGTISVTFDATLDTPFRADPGNALVLGAACLGEDRVCAFHLRHALELAMLLDAAETTTDPASPGPTLDSPSLGILVGLCAARTAARFWLLDAAPDGADPGPDPASWLEAMAAPAMPDAATLQLVWTRIRALQGAVQRTGADAASIADSVIDRLLACWSRLGPAETLMAEGGDARLAIDPSTGLNHYGCSHRPRPWAITFASSTASSLSERGFGGAEAARKRLATACLSGRWSQALDDETESVRHRIGTHYGLEAGCRVVLAPSGTDLEMAALALCCMQDSRGGTARPVSNVLLAPEETGTGVPMAAAGRHFADDTARGRPVAKGALIAGFPGDTRVLPVAIRDEAGRMLPQDAVDRACVALVEAEAAQDRTILLHRLDVSKTGLLAPGLACIEALQARLGDRLTLVVDACQARLDAARVRDYLGRGWMVMITGSKFFTGPPFAGALLLPPEIAARLQSGALPRGLDAYFGRDEFPEICPAADALPPVGNYGLALRWHAALAEINAVLAVPRPIRTQILQGFAAVVAEQIARYPALTIYPAPAILRGDDDEDWERCASIFSFSLALPDPSQNFAQSSAQSSARCLTPEQARLVYQWLNADLSPSLPAANADERSIAATICHIGQPVKLPAPDGFIGVLRVCAGARLLSGEPSHGGMADEARIAREFDDLRIVFAKIDLILKNFSALEAASPMPCYRAW
jgi:hypothetical protein